MVAQQTGWILAAETNFPSNQARQRYCQACRFSKRYCDLPVSGGLVVGVVRMADVRGEAGLIRVVEGGSGCFFRGRGIRYRSGWTLLESVSSWLLCSGLWGGG